jgi:hypothetical protein
MLLATRTVRYHMRAPRQLTPSGQLRMNAAELARPDSDSEADALSRCAAHPDHADDFLATRGKARTSWTIVFPTETLPDGRILRRRRRRPDPALRGRCRTSASAQELASWPALADAWFATRTMRRRSSRIRRRGWLGTCGMSVLFLSHRGFARSPAYVA